MRTQIRAILLASTIVLPIASVAHAPNVSILHRFEGTDGTAPPVALTLGPDDRLYRTSIEGGRFNR